MKITIPDLERFKENTLIVATELSLNKDILSMLKDAEMKVIPGYSGKMYYGYANFFPIRVEVFESNPSRFFPDSFKEVWNQSGMDHELIGHIYNFYSNQDWEEHAARETQVEFARHRGKISKLWNLAATLEPAIRNLQKLRNVSSISDI